jgi:hypothetical protein
MSRPLATSSLLPFTLTTPSAQIKPLLFSSEKIGGLASSPQRDVPVAFGVNFTVQSGASHVIYAWTLSGNYSTYEPPSLPTGLHVAASFQNSSTGSSFGMAWGVLSPGNHSASLSYSGYVSIVSIAVYEFFNDSGLNYAFASGPQQSILRLPADALTYIGIESTGGAQPVQNSSLTQIDEETPAQSPGETGLIGSQSSDTFSFDTHAVAFGILAVGVYPVAQAGPGNIPELEFIAVGAGCGALGLALALVWRSRRSGRSGIG